MRVTRDFVHFGPEGLIRTVLAAWLCTLLQPGLVAAQAPGSDTLTIEVGSTRLDGRVFQPHAARVRVYVGDELTNEWTNELTLGDSAGRPVMHWVTRTVRSPGGVTNVLRQTYDAVTLAPYTFQSTSSNGAFTRLVISGTEVRGSRRAANDTTVHEVRLTLERGGFFAGASDLIPVAAGLEAGLVMTAPVWRFGMPAAEDRIFAVLRDTLVVVEGTAVTAWKVEERRPDDRSLVATWYLTEERPYMVYGEVPLPGGGVRRMTEVEIPARRE
jgi:hypothetical protein